MDTESKKIGLPEKDYLTVKDVANYFGVGAFMIRKWTKMRRIRAMKLGPRIIRFKREEIIRFEKDWMPKSYVIPVVKSEVE